jgi:hypothetical protein
MKEPMESWKIEPIKSPSDGSSDDEGVEGGSVGELLDAAAWRLKVR